MKKIDVSININLIVLLVMAGVFIYAIYDRHSHPLPKEMAYAICTPTPAHCKFYNSKDELIGVTKSE